VPTHAPCRGEHTLHYTPFAPRLFCLRTCLNICIYIYICSCLSYFLGFYVALYRLVLEEAPNGQNAGDTQNGSVAASSLASGGSSQRSSQATGGQAHPRASWSFLGR
jgi:hypothetical protein